jgi:hypothetical protein
MDGIVRITEQNGTTSAYRRQAMSFGYPTRFTVTTNSWERRWFLSIDSAADSIPYTSTPPISRRRRGTG